MKIKFDKNQEYQLDAIQSVIDIFEGQHLNKSEFEFSLTNNQSGSLQLTEKGIGNQLTISQEQILENIQKVQDKNDITEISQSLEQVIFSKEEGEEERPSFGNFSVEMETGTGKTYVYLRSIYELNKVYGFKKFVIVVPSVAIREGVIKNLEITHEHFQEIYGNTPAVFEVYDSKKLGGLANFSRSNAIQILVLNIDSFTKDANIINQKRESGIRPIENIQGTSPIVIIDEPQNMETDIRKRAIANLNPLFTLRYSATHTNHYNLIYKLDPVQAYDLGLVKQIEVDSIVSQFDNGGAFISLTGFAQNKKSIGAKLTILKVEKEGIVKKTVTVSNGENLFDVSGGVEAYKDGYVVNSIDSIEGMVEFSGGVTIYEGEPQGALQDEVQKEMIKATIQNHLKKEKELNKIGIKVLSVFFIDKVANYRQYDDSGAKLKGKFAQWFEELLSKELENPKYRQLYNCSIEDMHDGYFSQDKGKYKDSKEGKSSKADDETFKLIMQEKERLLDMAEPLRFIFSHSALREGWDNPNVFQICTLNETKSELKKRQEIGRGLRLCVDSTGERNSDRSINVLTVTVNESYHEFAATLQKEIEIECGVSFKGRIKDKRNRTKVSLKKNWQFDQNFLDLWNRISHKTEYRVNFSTQDLIDSTSKAILAMPGIPKPSIQKVKTATIFERDDKTKDLIQVGGVEKGSSNRTISNVAFEIPDFVAYIQSKTELTRDTISKILLQSGRVGEIFNNPQLFMDSIVKIIKTEFDKLKVNGIKYEKIAGKQYKMELFEGSEIDMYLENLKAVTEEDKTLFNYVPFDSNVELEFAKDCETRDDILFYIKLPTWFKIKTPIGNYNPDWALIKKEDNEEKKIYFVAETKDTANLKELEIKKPLEAMKIKCGIEHFAKFEDVQFKQVSKVLEL